MFAIEGSLSRRALRLALALLAATGAGQWVVAGE